MAQSTSMPILFTTGSYYEVGFHVGSFYADRIKGYFQESKQVQDTLVPYVATDAGKKFRETMLKICQENFPQYMREIEGIADGSGVPFEDIFLLNISKEIMNSLARETGSAGCTDVMVNTPDTKFVAHNEDCDPVNGPCGYMVSSRIVEDGQEVEHHTAFCYPGHLAGTSFAYNEHGLVFSLNDLYTSGIAQNAPSRIFLNRAVLRAKDVDEAVTILKNKGHGSAYGFCTNIADLKNPSKFWSIELGPRANESLLHIHAIEEQPDPEKPCHYIHYNKFEHLELVSHLPDSSLGREKRANQMPRPRTRQEMLNILGDTTDPQYPVFRADKSENALVTAFTSITDVLNQRVDVYRGNPARDGAVPVASLTIHVRE